MDYETNSGTKLQKKDDVIIANTVIDPPNESGIVKQTTYDSVFRKCNYRKCKR